jgi:hypothetical protein
MKLDISEICLGVFLGGVGIALVFLFQYFTEVIL